MSLFQLALRNVKSSMKNYLLLILVMGFTILIFLNFQNVVFSDVLDVLGERNKEYIDIIVEIISVVLGCFMFFFIGYATNVFLTRRKKEIGVYVFMGLTNQTIGKLYMLEMTVAGIVTLILGAGAGILTTQLFQMILFALSDIAIDIGFHISLPPVLMTSVFYLAVYLFFVLKGYINIVKSSVLSLVSASRQNEYVRWGRGILVIKTVLGLGILSAGYYLAVKDGGQEVMGNVLGAVVLVIIGVYFLFGGFVPALFQGLAGNKKFLYHRQRNLWVNQVIFRMKKNYRTYAMVCILMVCSVTALSTGFAMKLRYENIMHFRNTYTYQLLSSRPDLAGEAQERIERKNDIVYSTQMPILVMNVSDEVWGTRQYAVLAYSKLQKLAEDAGIAFDIPEPDSDEVIHVRHLYLLSLLTDKSDITVTIKDKQYCQIDEVTDPYLGYLQENMSFYLLNDAEYERLLPYGEEVYTYNYRIKDIYNFKASVADLDELKENNEDTVSGRIVADPESSDIEWIKILYSLCVFMFMVFILASGSILFMKLYNDAFEEQERCGILQKIGCSYKALKRSAAMELLTAYVLPFLVMVVSSYFSVHALEKMMDASLLGIWLLSMGIIFVFFFLCYCLSIGIYLKNAGCMKY